MQNSAVMAVRATVLLVCLIAVPVAAICGKQAPEFVKSLIHDFTGTSQQATSNNASASEAPAFRPGLISVATDPSERASSAPASVTSGPSAVQDTPPPDSIIARVSHQAESVIEPRQGRKRRTNSDLPPDEAKGTQFAPGYFQAAEARLRALGATYYLLETLGATAEQYRFVCKVATGSQPDQMLAFFAVDRDPLGAMNNVVRQVESWRSHQHDSPTNRQPASR
jgi:hypothetical protein